MSHTTPHSVQVVLVSDRYANLVELTSAQYRCGLCRCPTVSSILQVKVISNSTTLIADAANKEDISMRVKQIKKELSETDSVYDTEKLSERIAKLAGGVAVIKVLCCHAAAVQVLVTFVSLMLSSVYLHKQPCWSCMYYTRVLQSKTKLALPFLWTLGGPARITACGSQQLSPECPT